MSLTVVSDILDGLYDTLVADATIAAAVTAQTLKCYDGPSPTDFSAPSMLTVGARPLVDDLSPTSTTWDWSSLGVSGALAEIDERIVIPLGVSTRDGNKDMRTARHTAFGLYAAAAAVIRTNPLGVTRWVSGITQTDAVLQFQGATGADCHIYFTAHIWTRI